MDGWKEKLLNQAGKKVIIKLVIQAITSCVMSIVCFPKAFFKDLCSMVSRFWWKSDGKVRGIHWKNWKTLTTNKTQRGIGFKYFEELNCSSLAKQAWCLVST